MEKQITEPWMIIVGKGDPECRILVWAMKRLSRGVWPYELHEVGPGDPIPPVKGRKVSLFWPDIERKVLDRIVLEANVFELYESRPDKHLAYSGLKGYKYDQKKTPARWLWNALNMTMIINLPVNKKIHPFKFQQAPWLVDWSPVQDRWRFDTIKINPVTEVVMEEEFTDERLDLLACKDLWAVEQEGLSLIREKNRKENKDGKEGSGDSGSDGDSGGSKSVGRSVKNKRKARRVRKGRQTGEVPGDASLPGGEDDPSPLGDDEFSS